MADPALPPLTTAQTVTLAIMGAIYWFVAALVVRWTAANWVGSNGPTALVFALIIVATVPALFLGMAVARVGRNQAQISAAIMTGTALLLDGVALTWGQSLYGTDPAVVLGGAASIMWGAGVAIALGMLLERPR
jgi:hypothetical protein